MKTSQMWWNEVKNSVELTNDWLIKQYRGEVTAASRIQSFSDQFADSERNRTILSVIAQQESQHAEWVLALLQARGITPDVEHAEERYWAATLPGIEDFHTGAAVGAHAEKMRLDRIQVIVNDETAPTDIRDVFSKILDQELFHERAFRAMSTDEALEQTAGNHELGKKALGLEA